MRYIDKRQPGPPELVSLRRQGKRYDDLGQGASNARVKAKVRETLLEDQRDLCCYCNRSLHPDRQHHACIEHYHRRVIAPERALDWSNLLAACSGGPLLRTRAKHKATARKVPRELQTCDRRKDRTSITIDPQDRHVRDIRYSADGRVLHPDPTLQSDIDEHLNLNAGFLVNARLTVYQRLIAHLRRRLGPDKRWTPAVLQRELDSSREQARYRSYFGLIEHHLERWITRRR